MNLFIYNDVTEFNVRKISIFFLPNLNTKNLKKSYLKKNLNEKK